MCDESREWTKLGGKAFFCFITFGRLKKMKICVLITFLAHLDWVQVLLYMASANIEILEIFLNKKVMINIFDQPNVYPKVYKIVIISKNGIKKGNCKSIGLEDISFRQIAL